MQLPNWRRKDLVGGMRNGEGITWGDYEIFQPEMSLTQFKVDPYPLGKGSLRRGAASVLHRAGACPAARRMSGWCGGVHQFAMKTIDIEGNNERSEDNKVSVMSESFVLLYAQQAGSQASPTCSTSSMYVQTVSASGRAR